MVEKYVMSLSSKEILGISLTIIAVAVALYNFLVYSILKHNIQTQAKSVVEQEKHKIGAYMHIDVGFAHWVDYEISDNKKFLELAIILTERGYNEYCSHLDESDSESEQLICQTKNNLAYYYAARRRLEDGAIARQYAEDILNKLHLFGKTKREEINNTYQYVQEQFPKSLIDTYLKKG